MPIHPCVCPHLQGWKSVDSHKGNRLQCSDEDPSSGVPLKKMPGSPVKLKRHKFNMVHDASRFFIVFKASSGAYMVVFVFIPIIHLFIIVVFCLCKCICIHIYIYDICIYSSMLLCLQLFLVICSGAMISKVGAEFLLPPQPIPAESHPTHRGAAVQLSEGRSANEL